MPPSLPVKLEPAVRHVIVFSCAFVFISEAARGVVLGSLSTYLDRLHGKALIGSVNAVFSTARLFSSLLGGWLSKHTSIRFVFELSLAMNILGSALYFFAAEFGIWALVLGRLLTGFGSGTLSVARAAIAEVTTVGQRTRYMAVLDASRYAGYAMTPVLGWLLAYVNVVTSTFIFDGVTTPGLLLVLMNAALLVYSRWPVVVSWFQACRTHIRARAASARVAKDMAGIAPTELKESDEEDRGTAVAAAAAAELKPPTPLTLLDATPDDTGVKPASPRMTKEAPYAPTGITVNGTTLESDDVAVTLTSPASHITNHRLVTAGLILLTVCNLVTRGVVAIIETVGSPLFIRIALTDAVGTVDPDSVQDATEFFIVMGFVGLLTYLALVYKVIHLSELKLLVLSFVVAAVGCLCLVSSDVPSYAALAIGCGLVWSVSAPLSVTITVSTFSKLVGDQPQGVHMGIITAAGSVGRIIFLLFTDATSTNTVMIIAAVSSLLCGAAIVVFRAVVAHLSRQEQATVASQHELDNAQPASRVNIPPPGMPADRDDIVMSSLRQGEGSGEGKPSTLVEEDVRPAPIVLVHAEN